ALRLLRRRPLLWLSRLRIWLRARLLWLWLRAGLPPLLPALPSVLRLLLPPLLVTGKLSSAAPWRVKDALMVMRSVRGTRPQASVKCTGPIPTRSAYSKLSFCISHRQRHPHCYLRRLPCPACRVVKDLSDDHIGRPAMGLQETKIESLPFVTAELNYLAPVSGKPRTYAFDPPPGEPKSTSLPEPHRVPIFDARLIAQNFSLDREGFALVRHPHQMRDFYNDAE